LLSELRITIAGLTVEVVLPGPSWVAPLMPRLGAFASDRPADLTVRVVLEPDTAHAPSGDQRVEEDDSGLYLRLDNFEGHLPPSGDATLRVFQQGADPVDLTFVMVIDSFLRLCLAQLLGRQGGMMFHAAGIAVSDQAGYVFFGPSGSGKTTMCGLSSPRFRVLCDEVIAVRMLEREVRLYGTPFNGAWGKSLAEDVPLKEMFYLRQAPHFERVPLREPEALRVLLESTVVYHQSTEYLSQLLDGLLALMHRVPVTQLEFLPKETVWETILYPSATP
jgi:hypothetical protein